MKKMFISRIPCRLFETLLLIGCVILFLLILLLREHWLERLTADMRVYGALIGGLGAAVATAFGTFPILFSRQISERIMDAMLGFGAGVMLAASAFSLIIPGLAAAQANGHGVWGASLIVSGGLLLGAMLLLLMEHSLPHEHFVKGVEGASSKTLRRVWMFVFAIALHNLPEGLAIGVAFGGGNTVEASALTAGIAIQDIPEGLVVALALLGAGYRRAICIAIGAGSGLIEPFGAIIGAVIVTFSAQILPWGLGFAAGAMLFVISHEIIPESHRKGHESYATIGLMLGFALMMTLDTALG
ncbi:MAG: ZIP family metal transporter [Burkholderiales bacterium]|jgi:ZIP family zinc transporter|nr:ZIP family metal transporter [Burkholderiales bacterium]